MHAIGSLDMEEALSLPRKHLKAVLELVTSSAVGVALLLGASATASAAPEPADRQAANGGNERVSERLAAIREAVSEVGRTEAGKSEPEMRTAWGNWRNGGWVRPWGNWGWARPWGNQVYRPWGNWRNGGWRNGGWRNGGGGWGNWR